MNLHRTLRKFYKSRLKNILLFLNRAESVFSEEDYHQLRVEIKKIRAFFKLLDETTDNFPITKIVKPFKKVYTQAGAVRDTQIHKRNIVNIVGEGNYLGYLEQLGNEELTAQEQFQTIPHQKLATQIQKSSSIVRKYISKIESERLLDFLNKLSAEIIPKIAQKPFDETNLHDLRKQLKQLAYYLRIIHTDSNPLLFGEKTTQARINRLQELLGQWNDCEVTIHYVSAALQSENVLLSERDGLHLLKTLLESDKKKKFLPKIRRICGLISKTGSQIVH